MVVALWLMHIASVPWIVAAIASILLYCTAIFSFRVFDSSELAFIKKAIDPRTFKSLIFARKDATP